MIEDAINRLKDDTLSAQRKQLLINDTISENERFFTLTARRNHRYPGVIWDRDADDLIQLVRIEAVKLLIEIADGVDQPANFEHRLSLRARTAIRDFAYSAKITMIANSGARRRRVEELVRAEYEDKTGSEPIGATAQIVFGISTEQPDEDLSSHFEMQDAIDRTLRVCADYHDKPDILKVAREMLSWFPNDKEPNVADIARRLRLSDTQTRRYVREVADIFRQESADQNSTHLID